MKLAHGKQWVARADRRDGRGSNVLGVFPTIPRRVFQYLAIMTFRRAFRARNLRVELETR